MGGKPHHQLSLQERLADEAEVEVLEVAEPAVHHLRRPAGRPGGVVVALHQGDGVPARRGVEGDPRTGDPATDHDDVERLAAAHRLQGVPPGEHQSR
jgi:hypothetical protein